MEIVETTGGRIVVGRVSWCVIVVGRDCWMNKVGSRDS